MFGYCNSLKVAWTKAIFIQISDNDVKDRLSVRRQEKQTEDVKYTLTINAKIPSCKEENELFLTSEAENYARDGSFCEVQLKDKYFKLRKL